MSQQINSDTILCGSFAKTAGSYGCLVHNIAAQQSNINMIYKSFSIDDIGLAIQALRTLSIRGVGITMPYKIPAYYLVDSIDSSCKAVGAINTILNNDGCLIGYNTDVFAIYSYLSAVCLTKRLSIIAILGTGGMSKAVQQACLQLNIAFKVFNRLEINRQPNYSEFDAVFNATPVHDFTLDTQTLWNAHIHTATGQTLALLQASHQFKLYTGCEFPMRQVASIISKVHAKTLEHDILELVDTHLFHTSCDSNP